MEQPSLEEIQKNQKTILEKRKLEKKRIQDSNQDSETHTDTNAVGLIWDDVDRSLNDQDSLMDQDEPQIHGKIILPE